MSKIRFIIEGSPKPQKRHRHTSKGWTYDPSSGDKKAFILMLRSEASIKPFNGAITVKIRFAMPYPKKYFRTGKFKGQLKPNAPFEFINRPDIDNLLKFVMDAGNIVLWHDDCQIWKVTMEKVYSLEPGTEIIVEETDESFQKD